MRLRILEILIGFFFTTLGAQFAHAASIKCEPEQVILTGEIRSGDLKKVIACGTQVIIGGQKYTVEKSTSQDSSSQTVFLISSPGGSVSEAMRIGRYIRQNKMRVVVPDSGKCFSSCVYILAAGVIKWPWGDIGIHRPYFDTKPNQDYDTALKIVLEQTRVYFRQMNIPEILGKV